MRHVRNAPLQLLYILPPLAPSFAEFKAFLDVPGGPVVKNPPTDAGNAGLMPDPGRFHIPSEQLSPCAVTTEPAHLGPMLCKAKPWR